MDVVVLLFSDSNKISIAIVTTNIHLFNKDTIIPILCQDEN